MSDASARTPEDRLREEYSRLLPLIRRTAEELGAEVRYLLIPINRQLESHERIVVKSRIKECESAIATLHRRAEYWDFRNPRSNPLSLKSLKDLAGIRILAFPRQRLFEIDDALRARFPDWASDPVPAAPGTSGSLAIKYHGYCSKHCSVRAEIQLMSMLIGLFWEVEHGALYKPGEHLKEIEKSLRMQERNADVIKALTAFETQFETLANDEAELEKQEEAVTN